MNGGTPAEVEAKNKNFLYQLRQNACTILNLKKPKQMPFSN